jgi:hypothetical protein
MSHEGWGAAAGPTVEARQSPPWPKRVAAPLIRCREASLAAHDGVVGSIPTIGGLNQHPGRSNKGGFAAFLLMSRHPSLAKEGLPHLNR